MSNSQHAAIHREPLAPLTPNAFPLSPTRSKRANFKVPITPTRSSRYDNHDNDVFGSASCSRRRVSSPTPSPLQPLSSVRPWKRVRENGGEVSLGGAVPDAGVQDWFPSARRVTETLKVWRQADPQPTEIEEVQPPAECSTWVRRRGRLGIRGMRTMPNLVELSLEQPSAARPSYLSSLATSVGGYDPDAPPSAIHLLSHHSPTGRLRDYSPALSIAFNSTAKYYDASSATEVGRRRLLAIAGEEGGVRIVDVDEGLGMNCEAKGWWWRAHTNAIFDIKWSADDNNILTCSGDQTTRLYSLADSAPRLVATLRGHTSSIKTAVFLDTSRSHVRDSNVVASGGRDGNILIYDLRCSGKAGGESRSRGRAKPRYSDGINGFSAPTGCNIDPVMIIKQAHGESGKRSTSSRTALRSVTSLLAMQTMPGVLASGGSSDGIVKLWDLRFPGEDSRADARSTCTPVGMLPDPTVQPRRRPRSVNSLVESPISGDLYALCGDSQIHTLRPSACSEDGSDRSAILPGVYSDPNLLVSSFYVRLSVSPDGKRLASGSCKGGMMTWDVSKEGAKAAIRFGDGREREVCAVDWGNELLAACSDDSSTRIWRPRWAHRSDQDLVGPLSA